MASSRLARAIKPPNDGSRLSIAKVFILKLSLKFWLAGGCNIEGEDDSWDFGSGAGFYVNATEEKWKKNYRMYSYVTQELPAIIAANFKVKSDSAAIMGHR